MSSGNLENGGSQSGLGGEKQVSIGGNSEEHRRTWFVPKHYQLPRKPVIKSLEALDALDSPERPGMMYESTLRDMVQRFDNIFGDKSDAAKQEREKQVEAVLTHLRRHTRRRRGEGVIAEGFVEWEQTSRVYELFAVQLNMFERIFFLVDVSESTSVLSQFVSTFLVAMIFISMICWMASTLPFEPYRFTDEDCVGVELGDCAPKPAAAFMYIETISVMIFTIEYLIRLFTVHSVRFELLNEFFLEGILSGGAVANAQQRGLRVFGRAAAVKDTLKKKRTASASPLGGVSGSMTQDVDAPKLSKSKSGFRKQLTFQHKQLDGVFMTTVKHILGPSNLIDLFAVLPFWIDQFNESGDSEGGALMVLRILRLTRIFRVFKLGKYNEVFTLFARVITQSMPALLLMLFFICLGCCLFGTLIWFTEQGTWHPRAHPELAVLGIEGRGAYLRKLDSPINNSYYEESPFRSIIHSFWYVIVTITTVGYGDIYPRSSMGKGIAMLTIINGIIVLAMPIGVVGANFSQEYYRVLDEKKRRQKLKEQLEIAAALEAEQDDAILHELDPKQLEHGGGGGSDATELRRIDQARQLILMQAEDIDRVCQDQLHEQSVILCRRLRRFMCTFLNTECKKEGASQDGPVATPVVMQSSLVELDVLTAHFYETIQQLMSIDKTAEFGLAEARDLRNLWAIFVDACWKYVVEMCRVEKPQEPPEYYQMKASMGRLAMSEGGSNMSRQHSLHEPVVAEQGKHGFHPLPPMADPPQADLEADLANVRLLGDANLGVQNGMPWHAGIQMESVDVDTNGDRASDRASITSITAEDMVMDINLKGRASDVLSRDTTSQTGSQVAPLARWGPSGTPTQGSNSEPSAATTDVDGCEPRRPQDPGLPGQVQPPAPQPVIGVP